MQFRSRAIALAAFAAILMAGCNNRSAEEPQPAASEPAQPAETTPETAPGTTTTFEQPSDQQTPPPSE